MLCRKVLNIAEGEIRLATDGRLVKLVVDDSFDAVAVNLNTSEIYKLIQLLEEVEGALS